MTARRCSAWPPHYGRSGSSAATSARAAGGSARGWRRPAVVALPVRAQRAGRRGAAGDGPGGIRRGGGALRAGGDAGPPARRAAHAGDRALHPGLWLAEGKTGTPTRCATTRPRWSRRGRPPTWPARRWRYSAWPTGRCSRATAPGRAPWPRRVCAIRAGLGLRVHTGPGAVSAGYGWPATPGRPRAGGGVRR